MFIPGPLLLRQSRQKSAFPAYRRGPGSSELLHVLASGAQRIGFLLSVGPAAGATRRNAERRASVSPCMPPCSWLTADAAGQGGLAALGRTLGRQPPPRISSALPAPVMHRVAVAGTRESACQDADEGEGGGPCHTPAQRRGCVLYAAIEIQIADAARAAGATGGTERECVGPRAAASPSW